jgi:hypothetical protein
VNIIPEQNKPFFNRLLQGFIGSRRKKKKTKTASAKAAEVSKRRQRNKAAYKSRRKNRIISNNLHHKFKG